MGSTLAIMFTFTTYGTWLRGDARGWVDDGIVFPPNSRLEDFDRANLKHDPYYFDRDRRVEVACEMVLQLKRRLHLRVYAICVQKWHSHVVSGATQHHVSDIAKCAKDAATWFLRAGKPIWGAGYDKRYCFDDRSVRNRIQYVERHNLEDGLPARFVPMLDDYRNFAI